MELIFYGFKLDKYVFNFLILFYFEVKWMVLIGYFFGLVVLRYKWNFFKLYVFFKLYF